MEELDLKNIINTIKEYEPRTAEEIETFL